MGRQIVKQPNGLYAQWSTVVDDFVMVDATSGEILDDWLADSRKQTENRLAEIVNALDRGEKPYCQFTRTFEECVAEIRERHGNNAESLRMLGLASGQAINSSTTRE